MACIAYLDPDNVDTQPMETATRDEEKEEIQEKQDTKEEMKTPNTSMDPTASCHAFTIYMFPIHACMHFFLGSESAC